MPARAERTVRRGEPEAQLVGEPTGELYDVIIFFGIIDILQDYDISKKLEHAYKSFQYDPSSISAVDPKQYSKRFRDFIFRIFVEDTWRSCYTDPIHQNLQTVAILVQSVRCEKWYRFLIEL